MANRHQRLRRFERKDEVAACPFCQKKISRPQPLPEADGLSGGRCGCSAIFLFDEMGKTGGQVLLAGLTLLGEGDIDRAMTLRAGTDYEVQDLGYQARTHSIEAKLPGRGGLGRPKLWFFRRLS